MLALRRQATAEVDRATEWSVDGGDGDDEGDGGEGGGGGKTGSNRVTGRGREGQGQVWSGQIQGRVVLLCHVCCSAFFFIRPDFWHSLKRLPRRSP